MRRFYFFLTALWVFFAAGCSDDNHATHEEPGTGPGRIDLAVTGRVGTLVDENLTEYVKSLDLLLFRENDNGIYLLAQSVSFTKDEIEDLTSGNTESEAGFTKSRTVNFENLPLGSYEIVGVGNIRDSVGGVLENASLSGVNVGNTMKEVLASITAGEVSPRLFFGTTSPIVLGTAEAANPSLLLFRKVAMFSLTLEKVPVSVREIDVQIQNTYGAFDMTGDFLSNRIIGVEQQKSYIFTENQPSLSLALITLPSATPAGSQITLIFRLDNGQVITIPLEKQYVLKANTITKLTATIDANQSGGVWSVELSVSISADVEWNVDQEPNIII